MWIFDGLRSTCFFDVTLKEWKLLDDFGDYSEIREQTIVVEPPDSGHDIFKHANDRGGCARARPILVLYNANARKSNRSSKYTEGVQTENLR